MELLKVQIVFIIIHHNLIKVLNKVKDAMSYMQKELQIFKKENEHIKNKKEKKKKNINNIHLNQK